MGDGVFRLVYLVLFVVLATARKPPPVPEELLSGFYAVPDSAYRTFQPLIKDPSGSYSLGFLREQQEKLSLSVIHLPSGVPIWSAATPPDSPRWGGGTRLFFNGSLALSDTHTGAIFWSTPTSGDRVSISNTSNLILQNRDGVILWQSFDFPTDTLVENQNFTTAMELVSSNGLYSMRLGSDYIGFYQKFPSGEQMYFKHGALEAKAQIVEGTPINLIIKPDGYMGMFQNSSIPADVEAFNTFQRNLTGPRRVRLEPDGNFKGYYWTGTTWALDYQAISDFCQLPNSCGSFGLCRSGNGCSCLDTQRDYHAGSDSCDRNSNAGDLCDGGAEENNNFNVLRVTGVELQFKELMAYERMASMEDCEASCAANCSCRGVVYSNSSGFCYAVDFPVQTLVAVDDDTRMGYFKVREGVRRGNYRTSTLIVVGVGFGMLLIIFGIIGVSLLKSRRRGVKGYLDEDGAGVGPYKDLGSASGSSSFRSIELSVK